MRGLLTNRFAAGFGALILANAVLLGLLLVNANQADARKESTSAARKAITTIFNYGPSNLDGYTERVLPLTTGPFTKELQTIIEGQIEAEARRRGTTIRTTVEGAAPVAASSKTSTVLLFVNQWRTERNSRTPVLNVVRMKVTMHRTSGGWRVAGINAL